MTEADVRVEVCSWRCAAEWITRYADEAALLGASTKGEEK